jgi:outer membrane protein insertion porin family
MRHCCAVLLLLACTCVAQQRVLLKEATIPREQVDREQQNQPYEGRHIASLAFRGNQNFSFETIRDLLKTKAGDSYYAEKLESDMYQLRVLLLARGGYLRATFGKPEIEDTPSGLRIVVPMQEGLLYRVGSINVKDSTVFSPEEVIQIFGLESGEIADGYRVKVGLEKLNKLYRNRGYVQFNAEFIPDFKQAISDGEEGVVDITFELYEGAAFRISAIHFEGNTSNTSTTDISLRRRLLIREGDVYNESLLNKCVERIYALGLYQEVSLGYEIDNHGKNVDITIRVREREN